MVLGQRDGYYFFDGGLFCVVVRGAHVELSEAGVLAGTQDLDSQTKARRDGRRER